MNLTLQNVLKSGNASNMADTRHGGGWQIN